MTNNPFAKLTQNEKDLTLNLQQQIIAQINNQNGSIPFSQYMETALYHPQFGYYNNSLYKFGREGDFITSPLLSDIFAKCLANQCQELFKNGVTSVILEIGAGNGQFMLDIITVLGEVIENYYILELSANLANLQKQRLLENFPQLVDKVIWVNKLPNDFCGVIIANEILDAMPCELISWGANGEVLQRCVGVDANQQFNYVDQPLPENLTIAVNKLPPINGPYTSELSLNNRGFMASLADSVKSAAILLIDYGYGTNEYYLPTRKSGTLRGFFRHHLLEDVLCYPGLIDITASVDFTAVASSAVVSGLDFIGYTTQANFLLNCQMLDIISNERESLSEVEYIQLSALVNQLISPNGMGEVFKVIGFSKQVDFANWLGFRHNDRSYTL